MLVCLFLCRFCSDRRACIVSGPRRLCPSPLTVPRPPTPAPVQAPVGAGVLADAKASGSKSSSRVGPRMGHAVLQQRPQSHSEPDFQKRKAQVVHCRSPRCLTLYLPLSLALLHSSCALFRSLSSLPPPLSLSLLSPASRSPQIAPDTQAPSLSFLSNSLSLSSFWLSLSVRLSR